MSGTLVNVTETVSESADEAGGDIVTQPDRGEFWTRAAAWLMVIGGAIGLASSGTLTIEKLKLAENPGYTPSCSLNPVMACSPVMKSWQASLFGFPNPLIGIAAFAVVVTLGVVVLSGSRLARWVWGGLQIGILLGLIFVLWLMYSSLYDIGKLCIYCMVVWAMTIALFGAITVRNLMATTSSPGRVLSATATYLPLVVFVAYMLVAGAILDRFWDYWSTLF